MALPSINFRDDRCIPTYSGRNICLLDPEASQIDLEDIAHGLAYQCCLNGQTRYFYSLAQHSMLVARLAPPQHRLAALLHEGAAAYLGDATKALRLWWSEYPLIEKRIMAAIGTRFSVSGFEASPIKRAHQIAQATELRDLCNPSAPPVAATAGRSVPVPRRIEALPPEEAKYQFTEMLTELVRKSPEKSAVFQESERCLLADPSLAPRQVQARKSPGSSPGSADRERRSLRSIAVGASKALREISL